jgi:hypothetical protein
MRKVCRLPKLSIIKTVKKLSFDGYLLFILKVILMLNICKSQTF